MSICPAAATAQRVIASAVEKRTEHLLHINAVRTIVGEAGAERGVVAGDQSAAAHGRGAGSRQELLGGRGVAGIDGGLIVAYHGFRSNGHRIVRFVLNADGLPEGRSRDLVAGWDGREIGVQGAPVDLEPLPNGDLLISEDRNGTILMLVRVTPK